MSELSSLDKEEVRRQYIAGLIPERFSAETSCKGVEVTSEESGDNYYRVLTRLIDRGITYFEERLRDYCDDLGGTDLNNEKTLQTLMNEFTYLEDYLMQTYRNRRREDARELGETPGGDESPESTHMFIQEVLTKVHPNFLQDVNLDGTNIMDRMVQDHLMTEDERESIVEEKTSRRRKEAFLMLMRGRLSYETLLDNFIPAVELDHPEIAGKIKTATIEIEGKCPTSLLCAVCNMKQTVDVKHLAEHLFSKGVISAGLHEELRRPLGSIASKWSRLLSDVSNPGFITEAIQSKFPVVFNSLRQEHSTDLECRCWAKNTPQLEIEDLSFATERTVNRDVANLDDLRSLIDPNEGSGSLINAESVFLNGIITILEQKFISGQSEYIQVNKVVGHEGGVLSLSTVPQTHVILTKGALVKEIVVALQVQIIAPKLVEKHLGSSDAASAIVTVDPRRRKLHKSVTIVIQCPRVVLQSKKNTILLCSIADKSDADKWENVTGKTTLKYGNDCVSFTSVVSARFWIMACPDKTKCQEIANALYQESLTDTLTESL